jgi:hypothetical protein
MGSLIGGIAPKRFTLVSSLPTSSSDPAGAQHKILFCMRTTSKISRAVKRRLHRLVRVSSSLDVCEYRIPVLFRIVLGLMPFESSFVQNPPPCVQEEEAHRPVFGLNLQTSVIANEMQDRCFIRLVRGVGVNHVLDENHVQSVSRGPGGRGLVLLLDGLVC